MKIQAIRTARRGMVAAIVAATFSPLAVLAAEDFSRYSNEELVQLRSQAQNMGEADRLRYREEVQQRAQNMSPEERTRQGFGRDETVAQGTQTQTRERSRSGEDNTRGQGELKRERERAEQGDNGSYGRGYESRQGSAGTSSAGRGGMGGSGRGGMGGSGRGR